MAFYSALGNYIHLKWKNYEIAGTYRNQSNWGSKSPQATDFDKNIFSRFKESVLNRATTLNRFKIDSQLKEFQSWYNVNRKKAFNQLKGLPEIEKQKFLETIVKGALKELDDNSDEIQKKVEIIAAQLTFDNTSQNLDIKSSFNNITNQFLSQIQKIKVTPGQKEGSYVKTFLYGGKNGTGQQRISILKQNISTIQSNIFRQELEEELLPIENFLKNLDNGTISNINNIPSDLKEIFINSEIPLTNCFSTTPKMGVRLSVPLTNYINNYLQILNAKIDFSKMLIKIQAAFSEAIAPIAAKVGKNLADITSYNFLKDWVGNQKGVTIKGSVEKVKQETQKMFFKTNVKNADFGFSIAMKIAEGKVDSIMDFGDTQINASIKNYNLNNQYYTFKGKTYPVTLSLVGGSPLTSFLFGAQAFENRIGTHFLNILTEHEDGNSTYQEMRQQGLEALKILVLYNALSGDLGIKEQKTVDVLIVDDKATGNSYFYSITNILADAINNLDSKKFKVATNKSFTNDISNILLANKKERDTKSRIAKVLQLAHQQKIYAGLSIKDYINKNKII